MKIAKLLALLLVVILLCGLMGCSKLDLSGGNDSSEESPSAGTSSSGGTELIVKTTVTGDDTFRPAGGANPRVDRILRLIEEAEASTGYTVNVQTVSAETLTDDFLRLCRAGEKYADVIQTDAMFFARHYAAGYLMSLEEAGIEPSRTGVLTAADGTACALRADGWNNPLPTASFLLFYNEKILTDSGLESPYELLESNSWNWSNFERLCREVTVRNPGEVRAIALPTLTETDLIWATMHAFNAAYFDGEGTCVMDSQRSLDGFAALRRLLTSGCTYELGSYVNGTADPTAKQAFLNRRTAFYVGNSAEYFDSAEDSLTATLGEDLRLIGFPAATDRASGAVFTQKDVFVGITSRADKELCRALLPLMFAPEEGDDVNRELIEDYFYHEEDGALYFELLSTADTHSALLFGENFATVEEMFVRVAQGASAKETLNNLQSIVNTSAKG